MALSGRAGRRKPRQLSGVKRTSKFKSVMSAFDPKRTLASRSSAYGITRSQLLPVW